MTRNEHGDVFDERFTFYNGRKGYYSQEVERGLVGYTIVLKRPDMHTHVHLMSESEAWDTINNHCEKYADYVEIDRLKGEYLTSDKGAWGRQDSF